ncbi:MAG: hypothetical protein M1822_001668 [Bathelium mastoideum]|nr:MAG: hypothetical protein M1822_001668 [Bathelium mastoideum]
MSDSDADGVGHSLDAPGDFNVLYTPTVNDALNEPSTSNPYSFTPVPLNQDRAWHSQIPFKTPPPSLAPTLPKRSRSKRPQPLAITSSPQTTTATTANTATTTTTDTSAASFAKTHTPTSSAAATTASLTPAPATHTCLWLDDDEHPCNQTFPDPAALHSHLKTAHTVDEHHFCRWQGCHTGIHSPAPHRFVHGALRHTWGHSHYRPYVCSVCNRGFAAANVLAEHHESAHLGRKAFTCAHCGYACSSASNLKRHVAERHARARFQCEWCARKGTVRCFRRGPNLARHFRKCSNVLRACGKVVGPGGEMDAEWFPPGYWKGKNGMDRGKVIPPDHLGADFAPPAGMDREMR